MSRPGAHRGATPDPMRRPAPGVGDVRSRLLSGHGSPEGKVPAGAGTLYQDVNPSGPGTVHRKTTPSGNTGWAELGGGSISARAGWITLNYFDLGGPSGTYPPLDHLGFVTERLIPWYAELADNTGGFELVSHPGTSTADRLNGIKVPEARLYHVSFRAAYVAVNFAAGKAALSHQPHIHVRLPGGFTEYIVSPDTDMGGLIAPTGGSVTDWNLGVMLSTILALPVDAEVYGCADVLGLNDVPPTTAVAPTGGTFQDTSRSTELVVVGLAASSGVV